MGRAIFRQAGKGRCCPLLLPLFGQRFLVQGRGDRGGAKYLILKPVNRRDLKLNRLEAELREIGKLACGASPGGHSARCSVNHGFFDLGSIVRFSGLIHCKTRTKNFAIGISMLQRDPPVRGLTSEYIAAPRVPAANG